MNRQHGQALRLRDGGIAAWLAAVVLYFGLVEGSPAVAAVSSSGNVTPVPPAGGGAFAGPFEIGDVDVGTVSITGGTAISHTGAAVLGDTVTGIGIANLSGLGSDWTLTSSGADMTVANNGTGSLNLSNLAFLSVFDDLFVAAQFDSLGEISINGMGTIVDIGDDANIGQRGQAIIEITNGGRLVTDQNIIGDEPAGDGRVTVRDPLSLWRATSTITIADAGRARMEVLDGGRVESTAPSGILSATVASQAGSTGAVEVSGAGSIWQNALGLVVGDFGDGSLVVAEEGRVSLGTGANLFAIGRQIGSIGRVEVRGRNSLLTAAITEVGDSGDGTLHILDGARVVTGTAFIGDNSSARGQVLIDGAGSVWEVTGEINVSDPGEAHLTISNGGVARSSGLTRVASQGRLTLAGGRLEIGSATGLLNTGIVEGSGVIESVKADNNPGGRIQTAAGDLLQFTGAVNNNSAINLLGGEIQFNGLVTNSASTGVINMRNGVLRFGSAGMTNNGSMAISFGTTDVFGDISNAGQIVISGGSQATFYDDVTNNGTIDVSGSGNVKSTAVFFGDVIGAGSFPGTGTVFLEGDLRPGASPAEVEFGGDLTLGAGANTVMEIGGAAVGSGHDQLDVAELLSVNGALTVDLLGGFAPQYGDAFDLFDFGRLAGQFDSVQLPALAAGLAWRTDELYTSGTVAVVPEPGATTWLVGSTIGGLMVLGSRRRRRVQS